MNPYRTSILLVFCLWLGGCETTQEAEAQRQVSYNQWINQSVATAALQWGAPQSSFDLVPGKRVFEWTFHSQSPGVAMPIGGSVVWTAPRQLSCTVAFTARHHWSGVAPTNGLAEWIIEGWAMRGSC